MILIFLTLHIRLLIQKNVLPQASLPRSEGLQNARESAPILLSNFLSSVPRLLTSAFVTHTTAPHLCFSYTSSLDFF